MSNSSIISFTHGRHNARTFIQYQHVLKGGEGDRVTFTCRTCYRDCTCYTIDLETDSDYVTVCPVTKKKNLENSVFFIFKAEL